MIRVNRPVTLAPAAWLTKAQTETSQAIDAFKAAVAAFKKLKARDKKLAFTFKFEVYGDDLLRDALNQIYGFNARTARPTCRPTRRRGALSAEGCSGRRQGKVARLLLAGGNLDEPASKLHGLQFAAPANSRWRKEVVRGKGNSFPLMPRTKRAKKPGQEQLEKPLLLNPELDDPEKHIEFAVERERAGIIRPKLQKGMPSPKGVASIDVYALDRPQLTQARAHFARRLLAHLRNTRDSFADHQAKPSNAMLKKRYEDNLEDLRTFVEPGQPYCAMARQIVRAVLPGVNV